MISIVIPTKNEEKFIGKLLSYLDSDDIIVVDASSTDSTREIAKLYNVRVLICDNGVSAQRNLGAQMAQKKWLLFFDADILPWSKTPCSDLEEWLMQNPCMVATGRVIQKEGTETFASVVREWLRDQFPILTGAFTLIKKDVFLKLGGFRPRQESFLTWEDIDLSMRCSILGYAIKFLPFSVIHQRGFQVRIPQTGEIIY